jgi:hypothetical protein
MLNQTDKKITSRRPLLAISKSEVINDYSDVISVLESIQKPIQKSTFDVSGFKINGLYNYPSPDVTTPLVKL